MIVIVDPDVQTIVISRCKHDVPLRLICEQCIDMRQEFQKLLRVPEADEFFSDPPSGPPVFPEPKAC